MTERYKSLEDLAGKIEWEGGIAEAAGYGIKASEMPEGNPELEKLWDQLCDAQSTIEDLEEQIGKILYPDDQV